MEKMPCTKDKREQFRALKKQNFNLSKKLIKGLTTHQLLLLLPTIVSKIIHNKNALVYGENSDVTDLSIFTTEEIIRETPLQDGRKHYPYYTSSSFYSSQRDLLTLPILSEDYQTTDNLIYKNEDINTMESLFTNTMKIDNSNESKIKKIKKYAKKMTGRYYKELTKSSCKFFSVSDANMNCPKQTIIENKSDSSGFLVICDTTFNQTETSFLTKSIPLKSVFEVYQISSFEYEEYIEFIDEDEYCFVDIIWNISYEKSCQIVIKPIKICNPELLKFTENSKSQIYEKSKDFESHYNTSLCLNFTNMEILNSNQRYKINSIEANDNNYKDNMDQTEKHMDSIDDYYKEYNSHLDDANYLTPYQYNPMDIIKRRNFITSALRVSSNPLSHKSHNFEINQKGDANQTEIEKNIKCDIDNIDSIEYVNIYENVTESKISLSKTQSVEVKSNKLILPIIKSYNTDFDIKKKMCLAPNIDMEQLKKDISNVINLSKSKVKNHIISETFTKPSIRKYTRKINPKNLGLATSKIVNGRFQHVWQCTYKSCMLFNPLKRSTCKNCLNTRWCQPPLCKRDVICIDCGYVNYKARLYCKKCKFLFMKIK